MKRENDRTKKAFLEPISGNQLKANFNQCQLRNHQKNRFIQ